MTGSYSVASSPQTLWHVSELPSWLGDYEESDHQRQQFNSIDAMAASGDYFMMIATRLDKLAQGLPHDSAEQIELEHLVTMMFYMHDHYELVGKYKKSKPAR